VARDPGAELDVAAQRIAGDPAALGHHRAHAVQRALGGAGLAGELRERRRTVPVEHVEHVEHGRDARRSSAQAGRWLMTHSRFHLPLVRG